MAVRTEEEIREAMAKYEELLQDEEMIRLYQYERRKEADRYQELKEAKEKGQAEKAKEIAKKFKKLGTPLEVICEATGLSMEEIEKL